jgi:hypothetical protein
MSKKTSAYMESPSDKHLYMLVPIPEGIHRARETNNSSYLYGELSEQKVGYGVRYLIECTPVYGRTLQKRVNEQWIDVPTKNLSYAEQKKARQNAHDV